MVAWLTWINILVLIFNLIPAFPLDGGRIARAIVWRITGDRNRATRFAATLGRGFSYLLIAFGLLLVIRGGDLVIAGIWLALVGFILGQSARGYALQSEFSSRIEGITVADVMDAEPVAIPEETSVERALDEYFLRYRWPWFPVVDADRPLPRPARARGRRRRSGAEPRVADGRATCSSSTRPARCGSATTRRSNRCSATTPCGGSAGSPRSTPTAGFAGVITADQVGRALRDAVAQSD